MFVLATYPTFPEPYAGWHAVLCQEWDFMYVEYHFNVKIDRKIKQICLGCVICSMAAPIH